MLERPSFLKAQDDAIAEMLGSFPDIDVLFGCFESRNAAKGKRLFNSAVVARKGKIVYRARKRLLPTYDVFDETRYFEPGEESDLYTINGCNFGVTVCEDVWGEQVHDYSIDPVATIIGKAKAENCSLDGIINISASPYQKEKGDLRQEIFSDLARKNSTSLFYCNQVGGQDSLIFDGRSFVFDSTGKIAAYAKGFEEDFVIVDTGTWTGDIHETGFRSVENAVYSALVLGVRDYVKKCGFKSVVLGLSGGIDSALTAVVAADALGHENVLGVALPSPYSSEASLIDARQLAENIGCAFEVIPIGGLLGNFNEVLYPFFDGLAEDLTEQNLQARIRGNLLMALSNKFGHLLLTTGNKSEMAVGYCTLYGDMSGGLAVISDVPKQLVYALSRYVNSEREIIPERIITKAPSAELKPEQTDQDDLPPYELLDEVLELHLELGLGFHEIVAKGYDETVVEDILRRVRVNEYKRKQAPIGLKVTSKAFGFGRRYPNVQNFRG